MPAARQRSRSPSTAAAVIAMTGIRRPTSSCARISRVAVVAVHAGHLHVHQHRVEGAARAIASRPAIPSSAISTS